MSTEVDARLYSYGTALMAALTIAAWHPQRWQNLWYGWLALLPFQMLAVFAVGMKQILLNTGTATVREQTARGPSGNWRPSLISTSFPTLMRHR